MSSTDSAAPVRGRRSTFGGIGILTAAAALVSTIACGGDSVTAPTTQDPGGPYGLIHVDKQTIPAEAFRGNHYDPDFGVTYPLVIMVTGGEVILQPDGRFHLAVERRWSAEGEGGAGTLIVDGTYSIQRTTIVIDTNGGSGTGSIQNGNITLTLDVGETGTTKEYTFRRAPL